MNSRCDMFDEFEHQNYNCKNKPCYKCKYSWPVAVATEFLYPKIYKDVEEPINPFAVMYTEGEEIDTTMEEKK